MNRSINTMESTRTSLRIHKRYAEAKDIVVLELRNHNQQALAPFTAGSHLEVYLKKGLIRHYSLLNSPTEKDRYVIAIHLSGESKGGSSFIHENFAVGDQLEVSLPRNNFILGEHQEYIFIAGGIGITPILSMIDWCNIHQKKWKLFYTVRNKQRAGFYEYLSETYNENTHFHFNDEHQLQHLDLDAILENTSSTAHIYCCGPNSLMQNLKEKSAAMSDRVHFEWFSAAQAAVDTNVIGDQQPFTVKLKNIDQEIEVLPDQTILEALENAGYELPFSCRAGICRTCETKVCAGTPDHLDMILSDEERAANQSMLICVSRSKSPVLELEI